MTRLLRAWLICTALLFGAALATFGTVQPVLAQQNSSIEDLLTGWEPVANRAEEAVENARASTPALEILRSDLVGWRGRLLEAQEINARPIATVRQQLDALGPAPEDGNEAEDIAIQRRDLSNRLAQLLVPMKSAEIAYNRADGLIRAVDTIIRDRQAEEILQFGPSPLNPVLWLPALETLNATVQHIRGEFIVAWSNPLQRRETADALPFVIVLLAIGTVLMIRGRKWSRRMAERVWGEAPGAGRWIAGFVLSMGSFALPLLGVFLLVLGVLYTELVGLRTEQTLSAVLPAMSVFVFARWLATRIFPGRDSRSLPLNLDDQQRRSGRWHGACLGLVAGVYFFVEDVSDISGWTEAAETVALFPLLLLACYLLFKVARLLRAHCLNGAVAEGDETYRSRLTRALGLALVVLAVISPVLAAIGYFRLSYFLLFPTLLSLQLLAALVILQRLVVEVYVLITGNRDEAGESLIPVLIGFVIVLLSLPAFALIWGARMTDLLELWTRTMSGFDVGGLRLSPTIFLTLAIVFTLGYMATRLLQGMLKNTVLPKTRLDPGAQTAIVSGLGYVGVFLAALIAITSAGIDLSSIAIVAGALSVGIGFGLQNIVSNFVSGIILLIERPIANGDWIEVGGVHGYVKQISVRSTVIETFDRSDVIVPNSDLVSGRVTNYTRGNTVGRVIVPVGVAYGSNTRRVEKILTEVAESHPMVLLSSPPYAVFKAFGADALEFEIRAVLRDVNWVLNVHSDMNHEIAHRFAEEGIEVPFAQRDIWLRNPEALAQTPKRSWHQPAPQRDAPPQDEGDGE